jgi:hypothetical protein
VANLLLLLLLLLDVVCALAGAPCALTDNIACFAAVFADEMDEFEQWQTEQANAAATRWDQQGEYDEGDIMDPAEIPLCNEYAAQGYCSAGEECCYIHGDLCEVRGQGATVVGLRSVCGYGGRGGGGECVSSVSCVGSKRVASGDEGCCCLRMRMRAPYAILVGKGCGGSVEAA